MLIQDKLNSICKLIICIISILFYSCSNVSVNSDKPYLINEPFNNFISSFPKISAPFKILEDKGEMLNPISTEDAIEYLDVKWLDEELNMPNKKSRAYGTYQPNDTTMILIYRVLELPVGSGDNISYIMTSFKPNGTKVDEIEIARFSSWDGGYQEQTFEMNRDYSIEAKYYSENEETNEKQLYDINISQNGGKFIKTSNKVKTLPQKEPINNSFEINDIDKSSIPDLIKKDYTGQFIKGKKWTDNLGENYLIFSTTTFDDPKNPDVQSNYLYVKHYLDNGDENPTIIWKTFDKEEGCMFDNMLNLISDSVNITDLDNDKIAESTYMYTLGCVSDVSPLTLKLIMHEGENKMAIRGNTRLSINDTIEEADYTIDEKSFMGSPESFLTYAKEIWEKHETFYY